MPADRVLFSLGGQAWTLSLLCLVFGLAFLAIGSFLFTVLLVRHGQRRKLTGREASHVAFHDDDPGYAGRIEGPARGVEVRMTFTIGDLRRAHQSGDRLVFWGVPATMTTLPFGLCLLSFWGALLMRDAVLLVGYLVLVPMFLIGCFMPWAALHTKLE